MYVIVHGVCYSGLMMLQTTNGVFDHSIYSRVTHDALLAWQRVRIANWLATNGKDWSDYVSQYNSGVYIEYTIVIPATLCYRYIQQPIHGTRSQVD